MKQSDTDRINRFYKAYPELKFVYTKEQLLNHLDNEIKQKKEIDKYFQENLS